MKMSSLIFLYSKYCKECKELIDECLVSSNHFYFVCVDNVNTRQKIIQDTKFNIKIVPCILYMDSQSFQTFQGKEQIISFLQSNNLLEYDQQETNITPLDISGQENTPLDISGQENTPLDISGQENTPLTGQEEYSNEDENVQEEYSNEQEDTIPQKPNSIMNLAQQMQRERESAERLQPQS